MTGFLIEHRLAVLLVVWLVLLVLFIIVWSRGAIRRNERKGLPGQQTHASSLITSTLPPAKQTEFSQALRDGRTIDAVKLLRDATGMDLAAAKDVVDGMAHPS